MKNFVFTKEELAYITRLFGEGMSSPTLRGAFRNNFYPKNPWKVSHAKASARVIEWLKHRGSSRPRKATGKEPFWRTENESETLFQRKLYISHIRECSNTLSLSMGTALKVLKKNLKWKSPFPGLSSVPGSLRANFSWRIQCCVLKGWYGQTRNGLC